MRAEPSHDIYYSTRYILLREIEVWAGPGLIEWVMEGRKRPSYTVTYSSVDSHTCPPNIDIYESTILCCNNAILSFFYGIMLFCLKLNQLVA